MKTLFRLICGCLAVVMLGSLFACSLLGTDEATTSVPTTAAPKKPQIDPDVSALLRGFYQDQLPSMALRTGLQDASGEEVRCDFSMLQKSAFVDYDGDGEKEIILLYDVSERTGKRNQDVVVFLNEKDGGAVVDGSESGSYGASKDSETYIISRYNSRICKVRFVNKSSYEAVLVDFFENDGWKTSVTAYHHISDHDNVKLEGDSCYIDHSGGELYDAVTGKVYYSKEKFLNFRTVNDNYNNLVTVLLAETVLP
ncbi:MAG: hypothetical protein IKW76_02710 [Clostridia bacterium]|nr:hypothetical protein [Clostridia bacterium]